MTKQETTLTQFSCTAFHFLGREGGGPHLLSDDVEKVYYALSCSLHPSFTVRAAAARRRVIVRLNG